MTHVTYILLKDVVENVGASFDCYASYCILHSLSDPLVQD